MRKIYWVIVNRKYYPSHGLDDVMGVFETYEEASNFAHKYEILNNHPDVYYFIKIVNVEKFANSFVGDDV